MHGEGNDTTLSLTRVRETILQYRIAARYTTVVLYQVPGLQVLF